jgi:hypothetical protein
MISQTPAAAIETAASMSQIKRLVRQYHPSLAADALSRPAAACGTIRDLLSLPSETLTTDAIRAEE